MADDPRLFYEHHIFMCNNVRPEGHPRGCCMARAEAAGGFDKLRGYARENERFDVRHGVDTAGDIALQDVGIPPDKARAGNSVYRAITEELYRLSPIRLSPL